MDIRLFRIYDKYDFEIGFGVYNVINGKCVLKMNTYPLYIDLSNLGETFRLCDSIVWCCLKGSVWHGHEEMNVRVRFR